MARSLSAPNRADLLIREEEGKVDYFLLLSLQNGLRISKSALKFLARQTNLPIRIFNLPCEHSEQT